MLKPGFEKQVNLVEECRRLDEKEVVASPTRIRAKVRFDYRGRARPSRFFFGGKNSEEMAVERREQQAALWRNVPVQGIYVEDIIMGDLYTVYDEETDSDVTFAPLELEMMADSLFNLVRFAVRDEFRRIKVMEPLRLAMTVQDMEQVFFEVHDQSKSQVREKTKRYVD